MDNPYATTVPYGTDGTVTTYIDGTVEYRNADGDLHRDESEGPALVTKDGHNLYFINGVNHRALGPAVEGYKGYVAYYKHGQPHNLSGPFVDSQTGYRAFAVDGVIMTEQEWKDHPLTVG